MVLVLPLRPAPKNIHSHPPSATFSDRHAAAQRTQPEHQPCTCLTRRGRRRGLRCGGVSCIRIALHPLPEPVRARRVGPDPLSRAGGAHVRRTVVARVVSARCPRLSLGDDAGVSPAAGHGGAVRAPVAHVAAGDRLAVYRRAARAAGGRGDCPRRAAWRAAPRSARPCARASHDGLDVCAVPRHLAAARQPRLAAGAGRRACRPATDRVAERIAPVASGC